jgi:hypothetical protein
LAKRYSIPAVAFGAFEIERSGAFLLLWRQAQGIKNLSSLAL